MTAVNEVATKRQRCTVEKRKKCRQGTWHRENEWSCDHEGLTGLRNVQADLENFIIMNDLLFSKTNMTYGTIISIEEIKEARKNSSYI